MTRSRRIACSGWIFSLALAFLASPAYAETLGDALDAAYRTNPGLQARREGQRALGEVVSQARAGYQPTLGVTGGILRSETALPLLGQINASGLGLVGEQPLYTGGRVAHAITAAEAEVAAGREGLRSAGQALLLNVIAAYVDVRRDEERLAISKDSAEVLNRQLAEAQANLRVKVITRTDLAQTEGRFAAAQTRVAAAEAQLGISQDNFRALVGHAPENLAPEPPIAAALPPSLADAARIAVDRDPRIRQAEAASRASAARVAEARARGRPEVSLRGSLGVAGGGASGASPFRGYDQFSAAALVFKMPLASGGLIGSGVRQAAARADAAELEEEQARRETERSVSQAWRQVAAARAGVAGNAEQVRAEMAAWQGVRREAEVGLRTPLDVLNAEQALREAQFGLVSARRDEYVASAMLLAAMGVLGPETLAPGGQAGGPVAPAADLSSRQGWAPWTSVIEALDRVGSQDDRPSRR